MEAHEDDKEISYTDDIKDLLINDDVNMNSVATDTCKGCRPWNFVKPNTKEEIKEAVFNIQACLQKRQ